MIDAETVIRRLREAATTCRALPGRVGPAALAAQSYGYVSEVDKKAAASKRNRIEPTRAEIAEMDEAMQWLSHITNRITRRIVAARSRLALDGEVLAHSWRDIGKAVGASRAACALWHAQGIDAIVAAVNAGCSV